MLCCRRKEGKGEKEMKKERKEGIGEKKIGREIEGKRGQEIGKEMNRVRENY